jgi:outer membrane protein assembly factor BamB
MVFLHLILYLYPTHTGVLKWKAAVRGVSASSPSLSKDGTLFLTTYYSSNPYNSFYSLSAEDGTNVYPERFFTTGGTLAFSSTMVINYKT